MFSKIIQLLSANKREASFKAFCISKFQSFSESEFAESLITSFQLGAVTAFCTFFLIINWKIWAKDGIPGFQLEFEEVVETIEANENVYTGYFEKMETGSHSLKICYISGWIKDFYYLKSSEKTIQLGYSFNWHLEYDLSEEISGEEIEFERCQKLDL